MKLFLIILWFLIFNKLVLFWFWLWQLKEYHWGRFRAHFESRALEKILHSFYGRRVPKFTPKMTLIFLITLFLEGLLLVLNSSFTFFVVLFFIPLIASLLILVFQIPSYFLKKIILKRAELKRKKFKNLTVIGITGSYGKTATKDFLASILAKKFKVLKTEKHINSELGIARTILNKLKKNDEIFIVEIGAYQRGKIREVCRMIKPKIGILTGINEQHMSTFGSQEDIIKGKYELIESLPENGLAIFNGESRYCRFLYGKTKINKKLVKKKNGLDNFLPWDKENFLLAAEASRFLGVEDKIIKETAENYSGTLKIKRKDNLEIIDSTYSANPKSLIAHLDYLEKIKGKKILVMPCLIELGEAACRIHREIGEKIAKVCDLAIVTTKDYYKELKESGGKSLIFSSDSEEIIKKIKEFSDQKIIILLESRVPGKLVNYLFRSDFIIKEVENKEQWENFLKGFERKSFLQSWNWGEFRKKMGERIWRWGIYKDNCLKGIALITKVSAKRGKFLLVPHGPVAKENRKDILKKLTEEMKKLARKENCSFIRINSIWLRNKENASLFKEIGFKRAPLHSHPESSCRLNLDSSEEEILKAMRKNTRYYIRKALRNENIKCFKSEKEEDLEILNELHKKVSQDKNFIPFSPKYIKEEFNSFIGNNQACLFIGKYKGKVIASSFVLFWSGIAFYHHAALSPEFRKVPISYLLQWEAIKEAKNRGCHIYDFWGYVDPQKYPNHPWAGPTLFKLGFGAQGEEYLFTQDLALSPLYYLTFIFEKIRKIKRGL